LSPFTRATFSVPRSAHPLRSRRAAAMAAITRGADTAPIIAANDSPRFDILEGFEAL
jgi:hypothetical protein